jgi:hypothetical protein
MNTLIFILGILLIAAVLVFMGIIANRDILKDLEK